MQGDAFEEQGLYLIFSQKKGVLKSLDVPESLLFSNVSEGFENILYVNPLSLNFLGLIQTQKYFLLHHKDKN